MSYGLEIYDASSNLKFDSTLKTVRSIFSFLVNENESGIVSVNSFDSSKGFISVDSNGTVTADISYSFDNISKDFSYNNPGNSVIVSFFNVS